eukprot:GHVL01044896.1.p1 GENE.GHVL01044896.1~~GHVL01044896.1.p1  ORF type:complete len:392 (+),score=67.21 GHVL01044896.1:20-1195(+)
MIIIAIFLISVAESLVAPGNYSYDVDTPNGVRHFVLDVPDSYDAHSAPTHQLHLSFHGLGDTCYRFREYVRLHELKSEALVIYPCGIPGFREMPSWNAGRCCGNKTTDDVLFVKIIIDFVKALTTFDNSNVVLSGFSNGAMLAELLGCVMSDEIKAVASVSGVVVMNPGGKKGLKSCDMQYGLSKGGLKLLNVHGDHDTQVPTRGNRILGFPSLKMDIDAWGDRLGCKNYDIKSFNKNITTSTYTNCAASSSVELVELKGVTHEWVKNKEFDTSVFVADFFKGINVFDSLVDQQLRKEKQFIDGDAITPGAADVEKDLKKQAVRAPEAYIRDEELKKLIALEPTRSEEDLKNFVVRTPEAAEREAAESEDDLKQAVRAPQATKRDEVWDQK